GIGVPRPSRGRGDPGRAARCANPPTDFPGAYPQSARRPAAASRPPPLALFLYLASQLEVAVRSAQSPNRWTIWEVRGRGQCGAGQRRGGRADAVGGGLPRADAADALASRRTDSRGCRLQPPQRRTGPIGAARRPGVDRLEPWGARARTSLFVG